MSKTEYYIGYWSSIIITNIYAIERPFLAIIWFIIAIFNVYMYTKRRDKYE